MASVNIALLSDTDTFGECEVISSYHVLQKIHFLQMPFFQLHFLQWKCAASALKKKEKHFFKES